MPASAAAVPDDVGEEVHVGEARDAAQQHLGDREPRSVGNELRPHPTHLGGPDALPQPAIERQVVREAAKQGHRGVRVRVHEARQQDMARPLVAHARGVTVLGFAHRQHGDDASGVDREREVFLC